MSDLPPCSKRAYPSAHAARLANATNPHRLRAYFCEACRGWHVTKEEYESGGSGIGLDGAKASGERARKSGRQRRSA